MQILLHTMRPIRLAANYNQVLINIGYIGYCKDKTWLWRQAAHPMPTLTNCKEYLLEMRGGAVKQLPLACPENKRPK